MEIALITGGSSGLGFAMAQCLIEEKAPLDAIWLIARDPYRLAMAKEKLELQGDISICTFSMDLQQEASLLEEKLREVQPRVCYWMNNAGCGETGAFMEISAEATQRMITINCEVVARMDHIVAPYLQRGSLVFHTASVAAFLPQPYFAVYAATKAFVLHYSRALHEEWKRRGIHVTAICPGPMQTLFFRDCPEKSIQGIKKIGVEKPERVARRALRRGYKNHPISISYGFGTLIRCSAKFLPHSFVLWMEKKMGVYPSC